MAFVDVKMTALAEVAAAQKKQPRKTKIKVAQILNSAEALAAHDEQAATAAAEQARKEAEKAEKQAEKEATKAQKQKDANEQAPGTREGEEG
jgi:hypothetical protein